MALVVVKVGGSLYDLPNLGDKLRSFLAGLTPDAVLVVPGGGLTADAIRALDRDQALGPTASHWLSLRACAVNAHFLSLLLGLPVVEWPTDEAAVLDPYSFALRDEGCEGALPHGWDATSDSVAARVAEVAGSALVLLKSVPMEPNPDWEAAAAAGQVDPLFAGIVRRAGLAVQAVDFRAT